MTCQPVTLLGGGSAIVCGRFKPKRCACGRPATLLCDWKRKGDPYQSTCDAPICSRCTVSPAPGRDLCATHAAAFEAWKAKRI